MHLEFRARRKTDRMKESLGKGHGYVDWIFFSAIALIFLDNILLPSLLMIAREKNRPGKRARKTKCLLLCTTSLLVCLEVWQKFELWSLPSVYKRKTRQNRYYNVKMYV